MGRRRGTSAFPVARIKKMMQSDDDVGKIATVTPVLVAKSLELMMQYVLEEAASIAVQRNTKTVTPQHLKTCVMNNDSFDFLRPVLKNVQPLEDDKKKRRRTNSPDGKRVRKRRDSKVIEQPVTPQVVMPTPPPPPPQQLEQLEQHLVPNPAQEEEEDYDEDDAQDDAAPVDQAQNGRMSVSALLS